MNYLLSDYSSGKDNNLNLIRFIAAFLVLFSHSFALVYGDEKLEPFFSLINMSLGSIAVDIFFIVSGFLITKSYIYKKSLKGYIKARCLRIYPALIPMTIFCVIIGFFYTSVSI